MDPRTQVAVFGGGCFWCTEALFSELRGVVSVMPGYAGGQVEHPTYEQVSGGATGHAEVTRVEFDPAQISYDDLLTVFFSTHDPTSLNRQGNDVGTQYRSVVFYTTDEQRRATEAFIEKLNEELRMMNDDQHPVVTELKPLEKFYEAEDYHRQYYLHHQDQPYCQVVIDPKLRKLKEKFRRLLKVRH